jgi:hypothetical protein
MEIRRSDVSVRLFDRPDGTLEFELALDMKRYTDLPPLADVIVECYTITHLERFPWGTVEHPCIEHCKLTGLSSGDRPLFRVKVIDPKEHDGLLLAAIDEVRAKEHNSLLPIIWKSKDEMGQLFWLIHFVPGSELQPELWMNKDVPGLYDAVRQHNPLVCGLVLPAAYKIVLQKLIIDDDVEEWFEDGSLLGRWLRFCRSLGVEPFENLPPDDDDWEDSRNAWIEKVVSLFAQIHFFLNGVARDQAEEPI